ncbi:MAG: glycoside hydrolase family 3 C-terminal domain-containing protein [Oscillospiraceae bacterium]|nr:glycoside hydrolase family 3 C-terminal domain-containing protein [Oscillospiraceae bacterium]
MKSKVNDILSGLTLDEKISLLTGGEYMATVGLERFGLKPKRMADGPHGVRKDSVTGPNGMCSESNCTAFPNLCLAAATWDKALIHKMGVALAKDCIYHDVDMLLGPGANIKRHALCGRNFEYFSEDPVLAGEMAAAYINGLQSLGVAASIKHYAVNNQEKYRLTTSVDADMRTLMEIYLKAFEIAVKKSSPATIMCAYNKLHSIWCSENKFLLTEVLRDSWGYDGVVVSDWGAVHNSAKAVCAGLDLRMPKGKDFVEDIKETLSEGRITEAEIEISAKRMIKLLMMIPETNINYDRDEQHKICREVAAEGMVLLKNRDDTLPITPEKYKKVAVIGEFAKSPLIFGQGSAEVHVSGDYIDSPLEEMRKLLGNEVEFKYMELYKKDAFLKEMLWLKHPEFSKFIADTDLVVMFVGAMESEDTEKLDRRCAELNQNYEMFIEFALLDNKKVVVVNQSGSAMTFGKWTEGVDSIVQMWLGGESAGGAIADVLCGVVNPSGKLSETFPTKVRSDIEFPGNDLTVEYNERIFVGYRYYDMHPEEIVYPFGHGLSYTNFDYSNIDVSEKNDTLEISFEIKNTGDIDGAEIAEVYVGDPISTVKRPIKELKAFEKVFLKPGETKKVTLNVDIRDIGYYNVVLKDWITEPGKYVIYVGSSSRDIRLEKSIVLKRDVPYTITPTGADMIG